MLIAAVCLFALAVGTVAGAVTQWLHPRPLPSLAGADSLVRTVPGPAAKLSWPTVGQAATELQNADLFAASPGERPLPTASLAKVMTAYVFLKDHPLAAGSDGPTFTVSPEEADRYQARKAAFESLARIRANQEMSEREALTALMTVSASNVADEMARWDGGRTAFVAEMNSAARRLGMTDTLYTDPSGLDAATVSTAGDQARLFTAALQEPEFAALAGSPTYQDYTGTKNPNSNPLLGKDGVFAGKTGSTTAAGKNLVFAAHRTIAGAPRVVVIAVMHQPVWTNVPLVEASTRLLGDLDHAVVDTSIVRKDELIGRIDDGWGHVIPLRADRDLHATALTGATVNVYVQRGPMPHAGDPAGTPVARLLTAGGPSHAPVVRLVTTAPVPRASWKAVLLRDPF
ncbi:D-alanyl-D-alanine carboxypeptidase family protein [Streptomyces sp. NPDC059918]|uniref:D-alanyl-D-alanine carboxypeptidase family protein n=1 Tax=unclassified Streptomyces TaxID=2593676 RepID=UPI003668FAE1